MTSFKPRAYAQGQLDVLCGLYAVVNAVRQAAGPVRPFRGKECFWLFGELVAYLDQTKSLRRALTDGLTRPHVSNLLRASDKALAKRFGVSLRYVRPFHGKSKIRLSKIINAVKAHQRLPAAPS